MMNLLKYFFTPIILFLIPIAGIHTSIYLKKHHDSSFYESVSAQLNRTQGEIELMGINPQTVCGNRADNQTKNFCESYKQIEILKRFSNGAVLVGVVLLFTALVYSLLLWLSPVLGSFIFSTVFFLIQISLGILILLQSVIVVLGGFLLGFLVFHIFNVGVFEAIIIFYLLMAVACIMIAFFVNRKTVISLNGIEIKRKEDKKFFSFWDELAKKCDTAPIDRLIIGLDPFCFVTAANIRLNDNKKLVTGITAYISMPALKQLTPDELTAFIAYELGHYKGKYKLFSCWFMPVLSNIKIFLGELNFGACETEGNKLKAVFLLPIRIVLESWITLIDTVKNRIFSSLEREAYKLAIFLTSQQKFVNALLKIYRPKGMQTKDGDSETKVMQQKLFYPLDEYFMIEDKLKMFGVDMKDIDKDCMNSMQNCNSFINYEKMEKKLAVLQNNLKISECKSIRLERDIINL